MRGRQSVGSGVMTVLLPTLRHCQRCCKGRLSSILIHAKTGAAGTVSNPTCAFIATWAFDSTLPAVRNCTSAAPAIAGQRVGEFPKETFCCQRHRFGAWVSLSLCKCYQM
jgi:hypothetical protein